jgi:AraC-like DNA-binding protein
MRTLISANTVSAADRLEFIREMDEARLAPVDFQPADRRNFSFELRYRDLGAVRAMLIAATPYQLRRTPALIRRSDPDLISLSMVMEGWGTVSQYDRDAHVTAREFTIQYVSRPYSIRSHRPVRGLQLLFPRDSLPLPPRRLDQLAAVSMPTTPGIGALTSKFLVQLARGLDNFSPAEAERLSTVALDLLAVRLAQASDSTGSLPPETRKHALLTGAHAFIQQHLGDPRLSPAVIAAAHHISTRYLHALFHEQGATVAGWIRQRRLEAARRDLTDPDLTTRSISSIAARWGFSSPSLFTQTFKTAYGMPPRDYRQKTLMDSAAACAQTKAFCTQH